MFKLLFDVFYERKDFTLPLKSEKQYLESTKYMIY